MSEKLKALLDKINHEGVQKAEENARAIEVKAKAEADKIIGTAKKKAELIIGEAGIFALKTKETSEKAIKQAFRDLVLSLKAEIRNIFDKIIEKEVSKELSSEEIAVVLAEMIKNYIDNKGLSSDIKVLLSKKHAEDIKGSFISKLQHAVKGGIEFKPSSDINAGFSISFDKGKSFFDFTDEGLTSALSAYLNPELAILLK